MKPESIKVLLIEDNPGDARLLKVHLSDASAVNIIKSTFELVTVERLSAGIQLIENTHFDVVLLDLSLPDSHGLDTFSWLQSVAPRLPIIVLSGLDDSTVAIQAVASGAQDYLVKGEVSGILLFRSIHYAIQRKRTEEEIKQANKKLQELDQLKSDFLSMVSHELLTPIAVTREGVGFCLDGIHGELNTAQREILKGTLENIDRLKRLVTDLLDVSKIEAGKIQLRRGVVRIQDLVKKVCEGFTPQAREKTLQLACRVDEKIQPVFVDSDKITQVFDNLISNAIRFTGPGGKISVNVGENEQFLLCSIEDTGVGIAEEHMTKVFSKFEQFGRVEGKGYKGTGLGLAICKGLVEKHGGKIEVESKPGKGTTFRFTLAKMPFPKILIVDDDKGVSEMIKEFLAEDRYQFFIAKEGQSGIEKAILEQPSLIVLDIKLPGMSGYEVMGRLKQDKRTHTIPIIVISAFTVNKDKLITTDAHSVVPVLTKPFERSVLRDRVKELLAE